MIAEVKSDFAVKVGDLLSPLQNALYCINREKLHTVKVLSASSYSPDEWERQCKVAGKLSNVVLSWAGKSASTRS